eukprot:5800916-Amphidinium_carterae.1
MPRSRATAFIDLEAEVCGDKGIELDKDDAGDTLLTELALEMDAAEKEMDALLAEQERKRVDWREQMRQVMERLEEVHDYHNKDAFDEKLSKVEFEEAVRELVRLAKLNQCQPQASHG